MKLEKRIARSEQTDADDLIAPILTFLAAEEERLSRFFALTGFDPLTLRESAAEPGFAASLLDYVASDERLFLAFAEACGRTPSEIDALRQRLAPRDA